MTLTLAICITLAVVALATIAGLLYLRRRRRRPQMPQVPLELEVRRDVLRERLGEILDRIPARSPLAASEVPDHPRAGLIEAQLLSGNPRAALLEAEELLLSEPSDPRVHLLLGRALIHCDEFGAASRELVRARRLGAAGPMLDYLEARIQHLQLQKQTHFSKGDQEYAFSPRDLITPFEMFMLELDRQRKQPEKAFSSWLDSTSSDPDQERPDRADIVSLLTEHFSAYYDCLDKLVSAVQREPAFTDALYHLARMAIKVGLVAEGMALMEKIEPLMFASPERHCYDRDLSKLRTDKSSPMPASLESQLNAPRPRMPSNLPN